MSAGGSLVPWVAGRAPLAGVSLAGVAYRDPWKSESGPFFERLRDLDQEAFARPLARVRPSWVFYDCALAPGALFGYALARDDGGLEPVSLLAVIPTLFGDDLLQSLGAVDADGVAAEELARRTLGEGMARLSVARLCATLPWRSSFLARFLAHGPLVLMSAWTPAHDEVASVTFTLAREPASADTSRGEETRVDPADDATLIALQQEIEAGARLEICARDDADGHLIVRRIP